MVLERKEYDPMLSWMHSVNTIGRMRKAGQSYKWCRGMFRHYLREMNSRNPSEDTCRVLGTALNKDTKDAIYEMLRVEKENGGHVDEEIILACMLVDVDDNEYPSRSKN